MKTKPILSIATTLVGLIGTSIPSITAAETSTPGVYDFIEDYSTTENPSGPWSYGWKGALDSAFTAYGFHGVAPSSTATLDYWMKYDGAGASALYHNPGPENYIHSEGSVFPPNTAWLAPGYEGNPDNFGVIRFTAPVGGAYRLESTARSVLSSASSGDYDFHVIQNGREVFGRFMPPQSSTGYTNILVLAAGDTIDFAVGRGADNSEFGSAVFLTITFEAVGAGGIAEISRLLVAADLPQRIRHPMQASLAAAMSSLQRGDSHAAIGQLQAFQHKVCALLCGSDPALAQALNLAADAVIDSLSSSTE